MKTVTLPDGEFVPVLGLGTWRLGEARGQRATEVAALRLAFDIGYRLVDTAEMYGEGGAEEALGQALAEALRAGSLARDEVFIVSKVYPHNASRRGVAAACDRSRKRLQLDHIDLYLLHWPGEHPLRETIAGFEDLQALGAIRHWGVSNFDTGDMAAMAALPGGSACATNQIYFALTARGAAFDLLPWQQARRMPLMAYSPIAQGGLSSDVVLRNIGERQGATAAQIALAWVIAQAGVMAIPKAVREAHLRENLAAAAIALTAEDLAELDRRFSPPSRKTALAMI